MNLRLLKIIWILAQGVFLPMVLFLDDLRGSGQYWQMIGVFVALEVLYLVDACLFLLIFKDRK